jgi:hypothetical protein
MGLRSSSRDVVPALLELGGRLSPDYHEPFVLAHERRLGPSSGPPEERDDAADER